MGKAKYFIWGGFVVLAAGADTYNAVRADTQLEKIVKAEKVRMILEIRAEAIAKIVDGYRMAEAEGVSANVPMNGSCFTIAYSVEPATSAGEVLRVGNRDIGFIPFGIRKADGNQCLGDTREAVVEKIRGVIGAIEAKAAEEIFKDKNHRVYLDVVTPSREGPEPRGEVLSSSREIARGKPHSYTGGVFKWLFPAQYKIVAAAFD